jgi:hypothetical protein
LYALFLITKEGLERRQFLKHSSALGLSLALALTNKLEAQDMSEEITSMSASELSLVIRRKDVRCVEVMHAYLQRIHRYNPLYNAIVSMVDDAELIHQAEQADRALDKGRAETILPMNTRRNTAGENHGMHDTSALSIPPLPVFFPIRICWNALTRTCSRS